MMPWNLGWKRGILEVQVKKTLHSPAYSMSNKLVRLGWLITYFILFRFSPVPLFSYRRLLLRFFGAHIGRKVNVYPSVRIWFPANLRLHDGATLGPYVNVYNQGFISVGYNAIVSQGAHLCASTHDYNDSLHPLVLAPIAVGDNAWVCADAFVGPGVDVAVGSVVGARAVLTKNTEAWMVYAGNPAELINKRESFQ